jgi:hypothetical protein
MTERARAGGGFVYYSFEKARQGVQPKIAYVALIPGTDILARVSTSTVSKQLALRYRKRSGPSSRHVVQRGSNLTAHLDSARCGVDGALNFFGSLARHRGEGRRHDRAAESVACASGKQTKTVQEIHSAVRAMNQVTQGSAAAEELNAQACSMKSAVSELLSLIGRGR